MRTALPAGNGFGKHLEALFGYSVSVGQESGPARCLLLCCSLLPPLLDSCQGAGADSFLSAHGNMFVSVPCVWLWELSLCGSDAGHYELAASGTIL